MANVYLTQASSGAPTLSGTAGTMCSVLDWALVQNGWAIEYTATNMRVYRPGTGHRRRLFVCHDGTTPGNAMLVLIRGCENATAASTAGLVDPFPTEVQRTHATSTVLVSNTASATARDYRIVVGVDFVAMATSTQSSQTQGWDMFAFGDWAADEWGTGILVGGVATTSTTTARALATSVNSYSPASTGCIFWCRLIDGSTKSSHGGLSAQGSNSNSAGFCNVINMTSMRGGYANRIVREKVAVNCIGSATSTAGALVISKRGWLPFVWNPLHNNLGSVTAADTFADTVYNASSLFCVIPVNISTAAILETSDTWTRPNG